MAAQSLVCYSDINLVCGRTRLLGCYAVWVLQEPTFRRNIIRVTRIGELGTLAVT
jgi:hypothetical protein